MLGFSTASNHTSSMAAPSELMWVSLEPNPVIEAYKQDVDRTLLRENLKLTVEQRILKMSAALRLVEEIQRSPGKREATDFGRLLAALVHAGVEFIVIGGIAATAYGSAHVTAALDIVYRRTLDNVARLVAALSPLQPYLRGAPPGLPFRFDAGTIERGLNFTLLTAAGDLDVMGEATGGGTYEALFPQSEVHRSFDLEVRFVDLEMLIHLKRAAGRPKDLERIAELEALTEERRET